MKMTPEQRAYYEYGKAVEALRIFKLDFCWREETSAEFYSVLVRKAWQKRAVCRRSCLKCTHCHPGTCTICDVYDPQYLDLKRAIECEHYEPRKEGA